MVQVTVPPLDEVLLDEVLLVDDVDEVLLVDDVVLVDELDDDVVPPQRSGYWCEGSAPPGGATQS